MADEYESISDYITAILKLNLKMRNINERMGEPGLTEILDLQARIGKYMRLVGYAVAEDDPDILTRAITQGDMITHLVKSYRANHLDRVEKGHSSALKSLIFTDMLNSYRKIKDHVLNIAEVVAGEK